MTHEVPWDSSGAQRSVLSTNIRVLVLGGGLTGRRITERLSGARHFEVRWALKVSAEASADFVLIPVSDWQDKSWKGYAEKVDAGWRPPRVVVCADLDPQHLWRLGPLSNCIIVLSSDLGSIEKILRSLGSSDPGLAIRRRIDSDHLPFQVRAAVRQICEWRPLSHPGEEGDWTRPSVEGFASHIGCSASHLYASARACGIDLGVLLRGILVIRGLELHSTEGHSWGRVAIRLGFSSASAWSNFVRKHWGLSPTGAARHPPDEWIVRILGRCVQHNL
jgi:AraC-like DNA-binding protein